MFSKLRNLSNFDKGKEGLIDVNSLKKELFSGIFDTMENSFTQRKIDKGNSNLTSREVDLIIKEYSNKNMLLATASSIIPGPFGILGSIPELLLNFGNQMNMIYDLGCAFGKENFISKDLLLDIPIAAFGGNTDLSRIQNNKVDLSDSTQKILLEKASTLGESIIERTLKKSIVQFIPIGGPILMGTWSKMTTAKVSKGAISFLDHLDNYTEHVKPPEDNQIRKEILIEKIKGLANLIESNNEINENQIDLISVIIENANLDSSQKEYYLGESIKQGSNFNINYQLLQDFEEEEDFVMQLIIMAKRSGRIDKLERNYIYQVGKALNLNSVFIDSLF